MPRPGRIAGGGRGAAGEGVPDVPGPSGQAVARGRKRVLVTGLSGLIGGALRRHLADRYEFVALNRSAMEGVSVHRADIADLDAIRPAFRGVDAVVHLAAVAESDAPWDRVLRANLVGTYNVFEAAREAAVPRVVYASSGATVSGYERESPYAELAAGRYEGLVRWPMLTHETPVRPNGLYGTSKVWGEALARHYADALGMSILCLRIGAVNAEDRPVTARHFSVWCSQRDVARMIALAVDAAETVRYDIVYVTSDNRWSYRDLEHARDVLGYAPLDRAENHRRA